MKCRHCGVELKCTFLDLGYAPPSNAYLTKKDLNLPEVYYPLRVVVCDNCWLVQTEDYTKVNELFSSDYAYFSSISKSWLAHAKLYTNQMIQKFTLDQNSFVVEIASNDGYLLKNFVELDIPCLGIEPTDSTAASARKLGINVLCEFFCETLGKQLASEGKQADLIVGNNVYGHVPDINDFTKGLKALLKPEGTITLEIPHLMRLIENVQFDTIYHEHFSYLSLYTIIHIFKMAGLRVWHVEELSTHGGSLRVYGCHDFNKIQITEAVIDILKEETRRGLQSIKPYNKFQSRVESIKDNILDFLIQQKKAGKKVVAYGAAAKGNTLLNFAGIKTDLLPCIFDAAPAKQGMFMPGSHIPILQPSLMVEHHPDYILILPWNLLDEVKSQLTNLANLGSKFVISVPNLKIV